MKEIFEKINNDKEYHKFKNDLRKKHEDLKEFHLEENVNDKGNDLKILKLTIWKFTNFCRSTWKCGQHKSSVYNSIETKMHSIAL